MAQSGSVAVTSTLRSEPRVGIQGLGFSAGLARLFARVRPSSNKGIPSHYNFCFQYFLFGPYFRFFLNQYCSEREFRGLQKLIIYLTETPQNADGEYTSTLPLIPSLHHDRNSTSTTPKRNICIFKIHREHNFAHVSSGKWPLKNASFSFRALSRTCGGYPLPAGFRLSPSFRLMLENNALFLLYQIWTISCTFL